MKLLLASFNHFNRRQLLLFMLVFAAVGAVVIWQLRAAASIVSIKTGNWSDPTVWSGGNVPKTGDVVTINDAHAITYDLTTGPVLGETHVKGTLTFAPNKSTLLQLEKNLIVTGNLVMKPASTSVNQTLRFVNINEANFVGGGVDPKPTDIGLWVMEAGKLDVQGTPKTAWARNPATITGWQQGDEVYLTSYKPGDFGRNGVESYTLNGPIPQGSEAFNLTRNVSIEGTPNGRSHVFIRSTQPQSIKHAALRYLGPRHLNPQKTGGSEKILGRWPLHFHMMDDASRGSMVEGVVARDLGSHAYVPHQSHGITIRDSIAYNVMETAFWWDRDDTLTHDSIWDSNLVAIVRGDRRTSGYLVAEGDRNVLTNSVASGVIKFGSVSTSGFHWPEISNFLGGKDKPWVFEGNVAHNNEHHGLFGWQNTGQAHLITRFTARNNGDNGIKHGAYGNRYVYDSGTLEGSPVALHVDAGSAGSTPGGLTWKNYQFLGDIKFQGLRTHPTVPTLFKDSTITGQIIMERSEHDHSLLVDFVRVTKGGQDLQPTDFTWIETPNRIAARIRVQRRNHTAFQIDHTGAVTNIPRFDFDNSPPPPPDTTPPTSSITSPANGATVSGTINITASASDNVAVSKVEFLVDGAVKSTDTTSPYSFSWDTKSVANGSHTLAAKAYDAAGNVGTSAAVSITVNNPPPPPPPPEPQPTPKKIGDINGDGKVNIFDLSALLSKWNTRGNGADLNGDGKVNIFDLSILLGKWGS